jgi:hypothetical protein
MRILGIFLSIVDGSEQKQKIDKMFSKFIVEDEKRMGHPLKTQPFFAGFPVRVVGDSLPPQCRRNLSK